MVRPNIYPNKMFTKIVRPIILKNIYQNCRPVGVSHPELALKDRPVGPEPGALAMGNPVEKISVVFWNEKKNIFWWFWNDFDEQVGLEGFIPK